jgi:hypothetical protein
MTANTDSVNPDSGHLGSSSNETAPRMNPAIKAQWVAQLRSGEYVQGTQYLSRNGKFCCLGVLCDLHAKAGLGQWDEPSGGAGNRAYQGWNGSISDSVVAWSGLSDGTEVIINGALSSLAHHNDTYKCTFAEIADAIEAQL